MSVYVLITKTTLTWSIAMAQNLSEKIELNIDNLMQGYNMLSPCSVTVVLVLSYYSYIT